MSQEDIILLDPKLRNWVLYPIFVITLLVGLARHYVTQLIASQRASDVTKARQMNVLTRSSRFRQNARFIPPSAFKIRKDYFSAKKTGLLSQKQEAPENPMMSGNPNMQMDMMKGQMTNMLPSIAMMTFVQHFFSGYVMSKVPFPLTPKFKAMLQQGVQLTTLDPTYVSSLSWYFLVMFGIRGVMGLFLGKKHVVLWGGGWRGKNLGGGPMCCCLCCSCSPSKPVLSLFSCLLFHCIRWFR